MYKSNFLKLSVLFLALIFVVSFSLLGCKEEAAPGEETVEEAIAGEEAAALDAAVIGAAIDGIKADMSELEAAADVIHKATDVILEGGSPLSDEAAAMTEAVHMSSHAMLLLAVHMELYIGKLDTYKADPESYRGEILTAAGKIESLRKIFIESTTTTDFSGWMEWPYTEKAPHDTVHILIEDEDIKATAEYKESADAMHDAMHTFDEAGGSMRLNLEDLADLVPPLETALDAAVIGAAIDGIKADMSELEAAADVIHKATDVILEGGSPLSDEAAAMTEAVHMSSHAMLLLAVHMELYIGKLDTYKADPESYRGEILTAAGKIESLRKIFIESTTTTDFSGWMEWPYTEKAPHDTVHILIEDEDIKATAEYKESADAMHDAMHTFDEAGGSMRLNLEDLADLLK